MTEAAQTYARAVAALNRGDHAQAWTLANALLAGGDAPAGVHFIAGMAALHGRRPADALAHLGRAHALAPAQAGHAAQYALALARAQRHPQALQVVAGVDAQAAEPAVLATLAQACTLAGDHARALPLLQRAAQADPAPAGRHFNLATALVFAGRFDEAEAAYEACLARQPLHGKAHLGLAQLRTATPARQHVPRLRAALAAAPADAATRMTLQMALAKELEDLGDLDGAFAALQAGKAAGRGGSGSSWPQDRARLRALLQRFAQPPALADAAPAGPIFVVGLPRTGTTLIERILSAHPQVRSLGERVDFPLALHAAAGATGAAWLDPALVARTQALDWPALGADCLARLGSDGVARVVDKFPHNFLYLPWIALALPQARFVCLRREPLDAALANFRQLFDPQSPFHRYSFDLDDCGRQVLLYARLLAHWQMVLPGRLLALDYEALVADPEAQARALLAFCGLGWDPACLRFADQTAAVATASAVQVRSPLHAGAIGRAERWGTRLDGLRAVLAAGLDDDA